MNVLSGTSRHVPTVTGYRVRRAIDEIAMLGAATLGALVIAYFALSSAYPQFSVAATLYMLGIAVTLAKPRIGAYLLIFLAIVGEPDTMSWYPFNKNGSSAESILFVDDRLVASPFEGYIAVLVVAILLHRLRNGEPMRVATPYTMPTIILGGAVFVAVGWGVVSGGELSLAINQTRALMAIPVLFLIFVNLFDRRTARTALWVVIWAVLIESFFALYWFFTVLDAPGRRLLLDAGASPVTHTSAIQYNVVLFALAAVALLRNSPLSMRIMLPVMMLPVGLIYVIAERRAAVGGLVIAFVLLMYVLGRRQPGRFWLIAPIVSVFFLGYSAAFWNSTSSAGFPVQAIKSQIVEDPNAADSASDLYRAAENFNLYVAFRSNPVLGTGFGKPFPTPIPLPDISGTFPLWQYFPHNSMLSLWAFGGVLTIGSWLYVGYAGVRGGTRATLEAKRPGDVLTAMSGTAMVLMVLLYSYLDISFDNQTMLVIALGLAMISCVQDGIDGDLARSGEDEIDLDEVESHPRRKRRHVGV